MNIGVVGTGYVGLVTGTCFAEMGNQVTCVDIDPEKVAQMQRGEVPIYEPGLEELFERNTRERRLSFTTDLSEGVLGMDVVFLALPTPPEEDGSADLSYLLGAASDIGSILTDYTVIVNKSTVPVGTAKKTREVIAAKTDVDFDVVSNPEFLREGRAVRDFMEPDRVVIGTRSERAREVMGKLYAQFVRRNDSLLFMDEESSETVKYAANAMLAVRISFMNAIAEICEVTGANVDDVRRGTGSDPRIGDQFLYAGIGYGGSCFPKDVRALMRTAEEHGVDFGMLNEVTDINERRKRSMAEKVLDYYEGDVKGKQFALWGLAFKPKTDDIREAPALTIIDELTKAGAEVVAYDPEAQERVKKMHPNDRVSFADQPFEALDGSDALIIATEWPEFREPDFNEMKRLLKSPVIFDGRNVYRLGDMVDEGFHYTSVGRPVVGGGHGE